MVEQLKIDAPKEWAKANDDASKAALLDSARRSYAFYLCGACEEPYFGGTIDCADQQEGERALPEDRLCSTCSPKSVAVCDRTVEHGRFHVWKCRYCCEPSTFVCYGNVHFCNACHDRNSERDARKKRGEDVPPLEAIPCQGTSCAYPKKERQDQHKNGKSLDCEQVYYCVCCQTKSNAQAEQPGSRNFIVNQSGGDRLNGWRKVNQGYLSWQVEAMDVSIDSNTTTNFVSSHSWCVMCQTVPIHRYVHNPSTVRIEASAMFMGRTDCPSVFRMEAVASDSQKRVLQRVNTDTMNSPADFWEKATLFLEPMEGLHEVTLCIAGKDSRFWRGQYGSKVCHCSVRVLGTEEELAAVMVQG